MKKPKPIAYTTAQVALIMAEYATSTDMKDLARRVGVTPKQLSDKAAHLGVKRENYAPAKPKDGADGIVASAIANRSELEILWN